jgi:uncharacterized protein (DUF58 family)
MKVFRNFYLTQRFFICLLGFAFLFVLAFFFRPLFLVAQVLLSCFLFVFSLDVLLLFAQRKPLDISRDYPEKLSNGDENHLKITLLSRYARPVFTRVLEELPAQFQKRDFACQARLRFSIPHSIEYRLRPLQRGEYHFGNCNVLVKYMGFAERRIVLKEERMLPCYPSFIQLRKYLLMATTYRLSELGVKRIRKIGATLEFERVKEYTHGDDYRFINWKATGKVKKLMINQYEDEKSQPIYSFLDTGRSMRMPFEGLTLLDYAINAILVLSNVALLKQDRAGLLTFSKKIAQHLPADKRHHQMRLISDALYNLHTRFLEPEFGRLYAYAKRRITQRALIFLYTNFETTDAMNRQLPYLRLLNKSHIIVVVIFKNTELKSLAGGTAVRTREIYNQIVAEKFIYEKQLIVQELNAHGIQTILTEPANLTVNSINKYLEIKARGLI